MSPIRLMNIADFPEVILLYEAANPFAPSKNIRAWTEQNHKNFPEYHLVYERNNAVIGAISGVLENTNMAHIEDIGVLESYRKKGIGGELLQALLKKFAADGIKKVQLWVHWKNANTIPFYQKHGFRICQFQKVKEMEDVPNGEEIILLEGTEVKVSW